MALAIVAVIIFLAGFAGLMVALYTRSRRAEARKNGALLGVVLPRKGEVQGEGLSSEQRARIERILNGEDPDA